MNNLYILMNISGQPPFILCDVMENLNRKPIILENLADAIGQRDILRSRYHLPEIEVYELVLVDEAPLSSSSEGMIWTTRD